MTPDRPLLDHIPLQENLTLRSVNPGAEKWLGLPVQVLDHGLIYLVDYMGDDAAIADAARVSYGPGTKQVSTNEGLIRYLYRNAHTSPFEMAEVKFHVKLPIFVARQWIRHRTANVNEMSGRYSILPSEFYIPSPEYVAVQSSDNKQGRGAVVSPEQAARVIGILTTDAQILYTHYEYMLNDDGTGSPVRPDDVMIARELARIGLSLNSYTEWYWKIDLRNMLHFLNLRSDSHAQREIQDYANVMRVIIKDAFPITYGAFEDYTLNARSFSGPEFDALAGILKALGVSTLTYDQAVSLAKNAGLKNKREREEFIGKLVQMGVVN